MESKIESKMENKMGENDVMDLGIPIEQRMEALLKQQEDNYDTCMDTVNRLSMLFQITTVGVMEEYLYAIAMSKLVKTELRIIAAQSLCFCNPKNKNGYTAINRICAEHILDENLPTPVKLDLVLTLSSTNFYKQNALKYFVQIINNEELDCEWRYKTLLNLAQKTKDIHFIQKASLQFLHHTPNTTYHKILCSQFLLSRCNIRARSTERKEIENALISFAMMPDLDVNLRADAADVLLQLGSDKNKIIARDIITCLGVREGVQTLYTNSQNVHTTEIEDSITQIIEKLSLTPLLKIGGGGATGSGGGATCSGGGDITFEYVQNRIEEELKRRTEEKTIDDPTIEKVQLSLNRINIDRALYSKYNCTLSGILLKVWSYIFREGNEHRDEMFQRLIEELIDMSGTCSTGFAGRLVNIVSGFGEFAITISFRDQIIANFTGRLNKKVRDIPDEELRSKVLDEMSINSDEYARRPHFLTFFGQNMLSIREEMYEEFKDHIDDHQFDLYFRFAISNYEGLRNFV